MTEKLTPEQKQVTDTTILHLAQMKPISVLKIMWFTAGEYGLVEQKKVFAAAIKALS